MTIKCSILALAVPIALGTLTPNALAQLPPAPAAPAFNIKAYAIDGINPLGADETAQTLAPYTGRVNNIERLREAARALETELKVRGFGFYRVNLPPQTVTDTVTLKLALFTLGKVEVSGNQFFSDQSVLHAFPTLVVGQSPNTREVGRNVAMFNDQEVKQVTITLLESESRDAIDARLEVKDSKPSYGFATLQNNGNDQTGKWRTTLGYQDSNFLGNDQSLTATYTTSPTDLENVKQYGFNWSKPIYALASTVSAYAVYSDVNSGTVAGNFDVAGQGTFVGAKWTYQLLPIGDVSQNISLALDSKQYVNKVEFHGQNTGTDVSALPVTIAYGGRWRQPQGSVDWHIEYASNLSGGSNNDDASYEANRKGASPRWGVARLGGNANYQLESAWMVQGRLEVQSSEEPLISGEQFGLGGSQTLRAYTDREVAGDSGQSLVAELWTPVVWTNTRWVAFVEEGSVHLLNAQTGQAPDTNLSSWGIGVRWQPVKDASVSVDAAQALVDGSQTKSQDWRGQATLILKF
jgi:hemolysin activation/secretion protein